MIICDHRVHGRFFEIKSGNISYVLSKLVCIYVSLYVNIHIYFDREMTGIIKIKYTLIKYFFLI